MVGFGVAQKKLAQTGFQFLSVNSDARAEAMAGAFTAFSGNSSTLFYNPAGLALTNKQYDLSLSRMEWIAGITYNSASFSFRPGQGEWGVFGLSILNIDYGDDIHGTQLSAIYGDFVETGLLDAGALSIGLAYGRSLTDKFAIGGQVKYVTQHLGKSYIPGEGVKKNLANAIAFDFGTHFATGFESLIVAVSIRNFSEEIRFEKENFQLPLTFSIGLGIDLLNFYKEYNKEHTLNTYLDLVHPRSYPEFISIATEYGFRDQVFLRVGYKTEQSLYGLTYGFGLKMFDVVVDYANAPFDNFDNVNRFSIRYSF